MNYEFPIIERIEDVLPAIEGRDEFIVAERDGFKVINYNVGFEDTFTIDENDRMENHGKMIPKGVMRRECRGIIFYPDGRIMSRPFQKFFNVGEREETLLHNLDLTADHVIMEKMDGSMIRPMKINGKLRLGTKMGITDTSIAAEKVISDSIIRDNLVNGINNWFERGLTPLFEFVSPDNRIVLEYTEAKLILLAVRNNRTGRYIKGKFNWPMDNVATYGSVDGDFGEYIERQRGKEGREGDVIRFATGHMLKIKNDWYVRIHKVKDQIRSDRHILALLLNNELDDVLPHMDENDFARVKAYEENFHKALNLKVNWLDAIAIRTIHDAKMDRKRLATELLPASNLVPEEYKFVFKAADGHRMYEIVMSHVKSRLGNTVKYNELAEWLGIEKDE